MKITNLQLNPEVPQDAHYWDQTLIRDSLKEVDGERTVVLIPGAKQADLVDDISMELKQYEKVLVIVTSDEENLFPIDDLFHPDMIIYSTYYNPKFKNVDYWLPIGYPKHTSEPITTKKSWYFAGQVTHQSRRECVEALKSLGNGLLVETEGFAQGEAEDVYYKHTAEAKVVPCPMGNVSDDSFRVYEALELGAVPIPEHPEFWDDLFGEVPFPVVQSWEQLPGYIMDSMKNYPELNNKCQAWWLRKKREIIYQLRRDCNA